MKKTSKNTLWAFLKQFDLKDIHWSKIVKSNKYNTLIALILRKLLFSDFAVISIVFPESIILVQMERITYISK